MTPLSRIVPRTQVHGSPQRRGLGRIGLGMALLCVPTLGWSQASAAADNGGPIDLQGWLGRVREAGLRTSFQGTITYSAGGVASSSRIQHICEGPERYERLEVLDGQPRVRYQHNERTVTVWPGARKAVVDSANGTRGFPRLPDGADARAADYYELRRVSRSRVAGVDAEVFQVRPKDRLRFAQRLWVHPETGLLLREDVLGPQEQVLESSAFSELHLNAKAKPRELIQPMKELDRWQVVRAAYQPTRLEQEGWRLARPVSGFQHAHTSKRPLELQGNAPALEVVQSVYTDGLAQVSVFIEPYDAPRHQQPIRTAMGATHTAMMRQGSAWITVVGEVPIDTVEQFGRAFEPAR